MFWILSLLTSTIRPLLITQIKSALWMVLNRWAMMSTVRPLVALSRASCTTRSDSASRALVASSSTRILGFLIKAREMAMRCFCPPDNVTPRSPGFKDLEFRMNKRHRFLTVVKAQMGAHTNHGVIAVWETRDEAVSIGLLCCINDLSICSLRLPKTDVLHDGWSKQNWLLKERRKRKKRTLQWKLLGTNTF